MFPACQCCKRLMDWQQSSLATGVSDLPDFSPRTDPDLAKLRPNSDRMGKAMAKARTDILRKSSPMCAQCGKQAVKLAGEICPKCTNAMIPCNTCGAIGVYAKKMCRSCYEKSLRKKNRNTQCTACGHAKIHKCSLCLSCYEAGLKEKARNTTCNECGRSGTYRRGLCRSCHYKYLRNKAKDTPCKECGQLGAYSRGLCRVCYRKNLKKRKETWAQTIQEAA